MSRNKILVVDYERMIRFALPVFDAEQPRAEFLGIWRDQLR